jgi:hypothetical protein
MLSATITLTGMDLDTALVVLSSGLQLIAAGLGFYVTLARKPPANRRRAYKTAFVLIGLVGIGVTWLQQRINHQAQSELRARLETVGAQLDTLTRSSATIADQTKVPPQVYVTLPPMQVSVPSNSGASEPGTLERFQLGGNGVTMLLSQYPENWVPIYHSMTVKLDWGEHSDAIAEAEIEVRYPVSAPWRDSQNNPNARPPGAMVSIFDATVGKTISNSDEISIKELYESKKPLMIRLPVPRSKGIHAYQLEAKVLSDIGIAIRGEIVLHRMPK